MLANKANIGTSTNIPGPVVRRTIYEAAVPSSRFLWMHAKYFVAICLRGIHIE